MTYFKRLQLETGEIVHIAMADEPSEADVTENIAASEDDWDDDEPEEITREDLGKDSKGAKEFVKRQAKRVVDRFDTGEPESALPFQQTIQTCTKFVVDAVKAGITAEVKTLKIEFGVELSGDLKVAAIAKSSAKSTLKVAVECVFPTSEDSKKDTKSGDSAGSQGNTIQANTTRE